MEDLKSELGSLEHELAETRTQAMVARDSAGAAAASKASSLRGRLRQALADEHAAMARVVSRMDGGDRTKAEQIDSLTQRASSIALTVQELDGTIDDIVGSMLGDVHAALDEEKAQLAAYKREYLSYEQESRDLGGSVLGDSFAAVSKKFYDILIKADVGVVDVAWAKKEAAHETNRKLTLDQARERKLLDAQFREVIDDHADREASSGSGSSGGGAQ
jgi:hypothetical protein